ncbi:hypothetical protein TNCV_2311731 [Trichonephila clavipes]|nr:hypothetical protein TNCV_2311731 [Trichonephila clavipes]
MDAHTRCRAHLMIANANRPCVFSLRPTDADTSYNDAAHRTRTRLKKQCGATPILICSSELGKTLKETYAILVRVHEDQALSMKCVYQWYTRFREGRESVSDKTRSGKPVTLTKDRR